MQKPLVSVLMTAFNREKYIAQTIESVLHSTYKNFELIIVDDHSSDHTADISREYSLKDARVKLHINEKNLGDYPNRNKAASYAVGKYIKYLDSDDLIYYYGLEVMVNYMEQFPEAGFGLSSLANSDRPLPILLSPKESYLEHFSGFAHFDRAPGSSIIRLDAFRQIGGFTGVRMIGDYEFWFKIGRNFSMVKFPRDLCWDRNHSGQESRTAFADNYPALRKKIVMEALANPDCPLNAEEIGLVKRQLKKSERKNIFFGGISKVKAALKAE